MRPAAIDLGLIQPDPPAWPGVLHIACSATSAVAVVCLVICLCFGAA